MERILKLKEMKMSKINFKQINNNELKVTLSESTPLEMVDNLVKSLLSKGLTEDFSKSTLTTRYFYKSTVLDAADKLQKALEDMAKAKKLPWWASHQHEVDSWKANNAAADAAARSKKAGIVAPPKIAPAAPAVSGSATTSGASNKLFKPGLSGTVDYKRVNKNEDDDEIEKSGYGPKKGGQYNPADNARRKAGNVGDVAGVGPNVNVKSYSTKPGQMSAKASADLTSRLQSKANKKQPVKTLTPEEIAAQYGQQSLKKSWGQHLPFPSAEQEIMRLAGVEKGQLGEDALANQLANVMQGKAMLGSPPPGQPTDQEMFGHLVVTEEMAKANDRK